jgi:hypothetical protein
MCCPGLKLCHMRQGFSFFGSLFVITLNSPVYLVLCQGVRFEWNGWGYFLRSARAHISSIHREAVIDSVSAAKHPLENAPYTTEFTMLSPLDLFLRSSPFQANEGKVSSLREVQVWEICDRKRISKLPVGFDLS